MILRVQTVNGSTFRFSSYASHEDLGDALDRHEIIATTTGVRVWLNTQHIVSIEEVTP